jgi:hypothetical protein
MPWRPPKVGDKHDARWNRISKQHRLDEPLCRMCMAAGRIEPATVVDHIKPLRDGGTHAESNLMALCKRCHDGVKTPSDVRDRARAERCDISCVLVSPGAHALGIDMRSMRRALARDLGWDKAHALTCAALEGMISSAGLGRLDRIAGRIIYDLSPDVRAACSRWRIACVVEPLLENDLDRARHGIAEDEYQWLRSRIASEWQARKDTSRRGDQQAHAGGEA